ncbi:hypothetical protein QN277_000738 [Acacia crassicarpa]|jgi:hypothetical protein
MRKN